jgi:thiamine-phosphate pyrophosphorylase
MNIHSDEKSVPGPHPELAIQVRDKAATGRQLYDTACGWVRRGYRVYVNDRADVALAAGAEGVQLPGSGLSPAEVRAIGPQLKIGMSIHSAKEVTEAADFCVLSPIFESPGKGAPIGTAAIREAAARGVPILALGGVDVANARECLAAGATGVAAIRAGAELARVLLA